MEDALYLVKAPRGKGKEGGDCCKYIIQMMKRPECVSEICVPGVTLEWFLNKRDTTKLKIQMMHGLKCMSEDVCLR